MIWVICQVQGDRLFIWETWLRGECTGIPVTDPKFDSWLETGLSHSLLSTFGLCKSIIYLCCHCICIEFLIICTCDIDGLHTSDLFAIAHVYLSL